MKHFFPRIFGTTTLIIGLAGCVDNKYDIDNANTLTHIPVKNLVVPLNLEKIYLDSIVDLTDGTNIEKYKDSATGEEYYALTEKGSVDSQDISLDPLHLEKGQIASSALSLETASGTVSGNQGTNVTISLSKNLEEYTYMAKDVDSAVENVEVLQSQNKVDCSMSISLPSSLDIAEASVENLNLQFPKGLYAADGKTPAKSNVGKYDPKTGILSVTHEKFPASRKLDFIVSYEKITVPATEQKPSATRQLKFTGKMGLAEVDGSAGKLNLSMKSRASLPDRVQLQTNYNLPQFDVKTFSGGLGYTVKNSRIEPMSLDNLPDFLKDPLTNILLSDPQFYLSIENPTAPYGTIGKTNVEMTSYFLNDEDEELKEAFSSESITFTINAEPNTNLVLTPTGSVKNPLPEFAEALEQVKYPELKNLLSGADNSDVVGLPSMIDVSFGDPKIVGTAEDFPVGESIGKIVGNYEFFAPLAFDASSDIVYLESCKIGGDEMDDLYVSSLLVNADCESSFPTNVRLSAHVYNQYDRLIGQSNIVEIPAYETLPVSLTILPENDAEVMNVIHHIDFRAELKQENEGEGTPLAPDQGLVLSTLRFTVDGYYQKKL